MSRQVFISYAHPDKTYADSVCNHLEQGGINCWIAPRDISPSKDWAAEIIEAISSVYIMVLVFSSNTNNSPQVRREVERAVHKEVNILPFRIEGVEPSSSLEYFISTQHWLDALTPPLEVHLETLLGCVKALLNGLPPDCRAITDDEVFPAPYTKPPPAQVPIVPATPNFSRSDLKFLEAQLAGYIGPMAKILVDKAAKKARSMDDLTMILSMELTKESERQSFRTNCKFLSE
jgi:hypothetical protein